MALYNPPISILPIFNPVSFSTLTSSLTTIDTTTIQAQTDQITVNANAQLTKYQAIGTKQTYSATLNLTLNTPLTISSGITLLSTAWYLITFQVKVTENSALQLITALTYTDNTTTQSFSWNASSTQAYGPTIQGTFLSKGANTAYIGTLASTATGTAVTTSAICSIGIIKIS